MKMISGEPPRMPMSGGPLTAEEIQLIRSWISQGAADDTPCRQRECRGLVVAEADIAPGSGTH